MSKHEKSGLSLTELVVIGAVLTILAGVMVPRLSDRMAKARDARRVADCEAIQEAIEQYFQDRGTYPAPKKNASFGGWDVSHDGNFINGLVERGYLPELPRDPINDDTYHYRYYVFARDSYGCKGTSEFYVLGVRNFETGAMVREHEGLFRCSSRNFGDEFAYVTGGGATFHD